jgi:hypothetical protein
VSFSSAIDGLLGRQIGSATIGRSEPPFGDISERDEFRRQQRLHIADRSKWEELDRSDLVVQRHWVEHSPTGRRFTVARGVLDAQYSPVVAFVRTEDGRDIVALEELR